MRFEELSYDVLVIGAGGAGLRAAIGAIEKGCKVGVVTKSLLGKAHTVMAEGGAACALSNVDPEDGWKVHFRDTMRGGKFLNNWRTVEIFAKEAPDRILELERYGAVFDRTPEGLISQRAFGGHKYRRLAHVGDRTGLELIRTLQDHAVSLGFDCHMETTLTKLLVKMVVPLALLDIGEPMVGWSCSRQRRSFLRVVDGDECSSSLLIRGSPRATAS